MILPLIVNPEAEADLAEAMTWYEGCRAGLGDSFLLCVEEVFERIRRMPKLQPEILAGVRLALVRRFPYAIVYRLDDDQITVLAVYHTHRNPRDWQKRF